jgi:hypothetical protein
MRELLNTHGMSHGVCKGLLMTVSTVALIAALGVPKTARASESDGPTFWIELGGQLEHVDAAKERFEPPFLTRSPRPAPETISPATIPHPARYSVGGEAKLSLVPHDTDWVFSAEVRYGRSNAIEHVHQQSYPAQYTPTYLGFPLAPVKPFAAQFSDTQAKFRESHVILDFQAGKDIGLGILSRHGTSTLNFGIRFAQFGEASRVTFRSDPDWHFSPITIGNAKFNKGQPYHSNFANLSAEQSFRGIGPSLSWNASAPIAGRAEESELAIDWGLNAAVLFGRQKASNQREIIGYYHELKYLAGQRATLYDHVTPIPNRSHGVVVPNVGGFAGLSFHYGAAKVSLGYRADFFFGAIDGGIDTRKTYDRDFYGPFAAVSIGLGG